MGHPRDPNELGHLSFHISQAMSNGTRDFSRGSCSVLSGSAQPARNGVFLYVAYDPLFLSRVPYAVLEIVLCPERRPACPEETIRFSLTSTGATSATKVAGTVAQADEM